MSRQRALLWMLAGALVLFVLSRTKGGVMLTASLADKIGKLIHREEGESLTVYQDKGGAWTVGKGHLIQPSDGLYPYGTRKSITQAESDAFFAHDTATARNAVQSAVTVPLNENQFAALTSLAYNIGASAFKNSTLVKLLNTGDVNGAANQFSAWVYDNGKVDSVLVNRRAREKSLFMAV